MLGKRAVLVGVLVIALSAATHQEAFGDGLQIQGHISIAPASIPIRETGYTGVGMTRLQFRNGSSGDINSSISEVTVQATSDGGFDVSKITQIRVYYELGGVAANDLGEYDNGSGLNDVQVDVGGPYTFTTNPVTIQLDPTKNIFGWGASKFLYIVFDLAADAPTTTTLGCEITQVEYGASGVGTGSFAAPAVHGTRRPVDRHRVTATAAGTAAATAAANATNAQLFRLDLSLADAQADANLASLKVQRLGGEDNWVANNGVLLYADDGDDSFEPGAGDGAAIATATLGTATAGYATLVVSPGNNVPASGKSFWVAVNMNSINAVVGQTFGLQIENPSTDITFVDEIEDDTTNTLDPDYAYVTFSAGGLYEYNQTGYVDPASLTAIPGSGNTFTVNPANDLQAPTVLNTTPTDGLLGVPRNQDLTVVFSEWMDEATVENTANFSLSPAAAHTLSYDPASQTLTVNITGLLAYGQAYTATVESTVLDYYGTAMAADYTWTFTIEPESFPTVTATTPGGGDADVAVNTTVTMVFSEIMNPATLLDANFSLVHPVTGDVAGSFTIPPGNQSWVFDPTVDLAYGVEYTATITTGVADAEGSGLQSDYVWTFTTILQYPPFTEPVIIKNRIVTGGNQQALVFVTEPPGGPADRVSVQVFTNTGRRVATLVDNLPFASISSPILWDGTNGKGQPLGPGLYYVQIRATKYKRVLKVLIVR